MPYIIVLNSSANNLEKLIDLVIKTNSLNSYIFTEKTGIKIDSCDSIKKNIKNWPLWYAQKWLLVGKKNSLIDKIAPCFFTEENFDIAYDKKNDFLAKNFDWAFFSYFSTYSERFISFITEHEKVYLNFKKILSKYPDVNILDYSKKDTNFTDLKIAVFNDYQKEGLLAHELAKTESKLPYLICEVLETNEVDWYQNFTSKFNLVSFFEKSVDNYKSKIKIFQIADYDAYKAIWGKSSSENNIAICTISGNSNLKAIEKLFSNKYSLSIKEYLDILDHTDWIYSLTYGGGADEHLGVFLASNSANTNIIWESIKKHENILPVSRF